MFKLLFFMFIFAADIRVFSDAEDSVLYVHICSCFPESSLTLKWLFFMFIFASVYPSLH